MSLEDDAAWLRMEANQLFERINIVARQVNSADRTDIQKAGDVALMAAVLCQVLREIQKRGLFKELLQDVSQDLQSGRISIKGIREDIRKIIVLERSLLTGFDLSEGATDALLAAFADSATLRQWPDIVLLSFTKNIERAIDEVCSVPKSGSVLWAKQTLKNARKRYGMVGGVAVAATNAAAVALGTDPTLGSVSKFVGAIIVMDGTGPANEG